MTRPKSHAEWAKVGSASRERDKARHLNERRVQRFMTWLAGARTRMFVVFNKQDLKDLRR